MKKNYLYIYSLLVFIIITGCSTNNSSQLLISKNLYNDQIFPNYHLIAIESETDIFALDDEMKEMVHNKLLTVNDSYERAQKLLDHLFSNDNINIAYENSSNLTATQTFHSKKANCMSLTIMSYALAKEAELAVEFKDVQIPEYWVRNGQYSMLSGHVNLLVKAPFSKSTVIAWNNTLQIDFDPYVVKKNFPKKTVDKQTILAMFYNNIGAQAIVDKDYNKAYAYLKKATIVSPTFASAWSNLGIIYRQIGAYQLANKIYKHALKLEPENLSILDNLALLLKKQGAMNEAKKLEQKIHNSRLKNPYYHAMLGDEALFKGDIIAAKKHFKEALHINQNIHEFYYGLAKAYYQLDEYENAQDTLEKAIKLNKAKSTEHQYIAKLEWMKASAINDY